MKRGRARIFKLSSYAEFRERGCARMCWSSRYADFEGSEGAPLRVECFGHNLFTKYSTSLNRTTVFMMYTVQ